MTSSAKSRGGHLLGGHLRVVKRATARQTVPAMTTSSQPSGDGQDTISSEVLKAVLLVRLRRILTAKL